MRNIIQLLIEDLVSAQRGLTRALLKRDSAARKLELDKRDAAALKIEEYAQGLDTERARLAEECHRLANEVMQIRYVAQLMRESAPLVLSEAESRASAVVRVPDPALRSFAAAIDDAIRNGHAQRVRNDIVITYPGLLELARAADTRERLAEMRTENFQLGRQLHAIRTAEAKVS